MTARPAIDLTQQAASGPEPSGRRIWSLVEVTLAFAVVHVTYRAFKHFTPLGRIEGAAHLNYSPGACMILFSVAAIWARGRSFDGYGLTLRNWRSNMNVGLVWGVLQVVLVGLIVKAAHVQADGGITPKLFPVCAAGALLLTALMLLMLRRDRHWLHIRAAISLPLIFVLLSLPALVAMHHHRSVAHAIAAIGWSFFGAGFGEEIFFRGFVQSRVNQAFSRPLRLLGMQFGLGLIVSSLLFGFIHALNAVDYFQTRWTFAWTMGAAEVFAGIFLGAMHEKTGSVLPGAIAHGLGDVLPLVVVMR